MAKTDSQSNRSSDSKTFLWVALASTLLALPVHGYLLSEHFALKFGAADTKSICDINATFNCTAIAASSYSELFGIPIAMLGFSANLALAFLLLWFPLTEQDKRRAALRNLLLVSGVIAGTSLVMGVISSVAVGIYCLFCITAYILSFVTFGSVFAMFKRQPKAPLSAPGFRFGDLTPVIVLAFVGALGSFIGKDQIAKSYGSAEMGPIVKQYVQDWKANPKHEIATIDPIVMGPEAKDARMTIVEFADFRCIHCKHAAPVLKAFARAHPDVRFEFQTWALDGECNSKIGIANGVSCLLGRLAWCANTKNKTGWQTHEYLFEKDAYMSVEAIQGDLAEISKVAGMDEAALKACADSEEAKSALRKQADLGSQLNLQGTPTIFANGRQLPGGQVLSVLREAYNQSP